MPLYTFFPLLISIFANTRYALNRNVFDGALGRMYAANIYLFAFFFLFIFTFCVRDVTLCYEVFGAKASIYRLHQCFLASDTRSRGLK